MLFLPLRMMELMNLAASLLPCLGSGSVSRLVTSRLLGMRLLPSLETGGVTPRSGLTWPETRHGPRQPASVAHAHGDQPSTGYFGLLAPYLDRPLRRSCTPVASRVPRMIWYRTPGRSLTRPPRISTTECSWRLCPSPGMYDVTSIPLDKRTRATLRRAELGFFGVTVETRVQTPRFCGE